MVSQRPTTATGNRTRSRGQTVVELAFLLPALTFLMLGSLDLGRAYYFYAGVTNASRVGAQYAMDVRIPNDKVIQEVIAEASPYVVLTSDKVTINTASKAIGSDYTVQVVFTYQFLTPGANKIWGSGITMTCQSTGRYH
jgi:Flp pilus assembly protein TadG